MLFPSYAAHRAFLVHSFVAGSLGRNVSYGYLLSLLAAIRPLYRDIA